MPEWRTEILRRLAGAKLRPEREAEIVDEVAQHLEDRYREKLAMGQAPADAELSAWSELAADGVLASEIARAEPAARPMPPIGAPARGLFLRALAQDARYAVRRLVKRPAFTLTALVTLALTIGPTTAVVGIADALFFRPPAGIAQPNRILLIDFANRSKDSSYSPWAISYENVAGLLEKSRTMVDMAGQQELPAGFAANGSEPQRVDGQSVKSNYFRVLGVRLAAGRELLPEEDATPGGITSVVLASSLATQFFGSEQAAVGQTVQLNSVSFTVVGVAAAGFAGTSRSGPARFWVTGRALHRVRHYDQSIWTMRPNRGPFFTYLVRLAPGATVEAATAELETLTKSVPDATEISGIKLLPGYGAPKSLNVNGVTIVRLLSWVAAALVLLGIANVANLLIFQGLKLGRDVAVRKARGASAGRLVQMALVESLLLSIVGAGIGIGVALGIQYLLSDIKVWGVGTLDVPLDWRVVGGTAALAILSGVAFGVGPGMMAARGTHVSTVGRGSRGEMPGTGRVRQALAATQLAISLTLLIGALLFAGTLRNLRGIELGFNPTNVSSMALDLRSHGYDQPKMWEFYRQFLGRVRAEPGIDAVAIGYALPIAGISFSTAMHPAGGDPKAGKEMLMNYVSSDYFDVLKIPIARGRSFTPAESFIDGESPIVILSASAAKALFGDADPIGHKVTEPRRVPRDYTVVGVTGDVKWLLLTEQPPAVMYFPFSSGIAVTGGTVVARSARPPDEVRRIFKSAAASIDPATPLYRDQTMDAIVNARIAQQRLFAIVLSLLGGIAFVLAAVGLHGVISQMVAERSRELGIRVAIGASRGEVIRLVVRQAGLVAAAGLVIGLTVAWLAGRYVETHLYGVTSRDAVTYAIAAGLLMVVVALALIAPLRAALRVEPISVLRSE